ncbi:unnamed protein product [Callosobruchus maculatus]|uniref:Uncharacterized protein n=1 Tax=Callosobruchus maculatus TaxID=64391 RepID=A0A653CWS1_CALMS|nr:unnamed protein product [Callosobruchus maculatus]
MLSIYDHNLGLVVARLLPATTVHFRLLAHPSVTAAFLRPPPTHLSRPPLPLRISPQGRRQGHHQLRIKGLCESSEYEEGKAEIQPTTAKAGTAVLSQTNVECSFAPSSCNFSSGPTTQGPPRRSSFFCRERTTRAGVVTAPARANNRRRRRRCSGGGGSTASAGRRGRDIGGRGRRRPARLAVRRGASAAISSSRV